MTALRLDAEAVEDPDLARRLGEHIGVLQRSIDAIVHEARRPVRTDLRAGLRRDGRRSVTGWRSGGRSPRTRDAADECRIPDAGAAGCRWRADDLADVVDVLIDNVFAHTPEPTGFAVRLATRTATVRLVVTDDGPGPAGPAGDRPGRPGWASTSPGVRRSGCGGST